MSQISNRQEFLERAAQAYRISQQERGLKDGSLVRLPGSDACLPREEAQAFESDLNAQGLAILQAGEDKSNSVPIYLPDARNYVLVRPLTP